MVIITILTGIWEISFLVTYDSVVYNTQDLIKNQTHVWTNKYDFSYTNPWKLSQIFYSEYGAWVDREYMSLNDSWSHTVEAH